MHRLFQFSPPRGGRRTVLLCCACPLYFNSRPRVGGRLCPDCGMDEALRISILAPAWGGATGQNIRFVHCGAISILAPARGATPRRRHSFRPSSHFNSRSRAGGDWHGCKFHQDYSYFNSRPRTGGDLVYNDGTSNERNFNSRPHAGGDDIVHRHSRGIHISIPAPARGATLPGTAVCTSTSFQFPPPHGGRRN